MASSLVLATLRTRARDILMDSGAAVWANDQIDTGIRLALEEYSRAGMAQGAPVRGRMLIGTITPGAGVREVDLSSLTGFLGLHRVWFPFQNIAGELPRWITFEGFWSDTTPKMLMLSAVGDGAMVARCFYFAQHALNGLDSAIATTFDAKDDNLIALGVCGHACNMRSVDKTEDTSLATVATPNYAALAKSFLADFRRSLVPRGVVSVVPQTRGTRVVYDARVLGWREIR